MIRKSIKSKSSVIIYQTKSGAIQLRGDSAHETIWATQAEIAQIFGVQPQAITKHIKNIYSDKELFEKSTCSKMEQVRTEGERTIKRSLDIYNLEILIAIGYRINSVLGTKFRQWATKTLRDYVTKGYALNPVTLKYNYAEFQAAIKSVQKLLPLDANIKTADILELISAFADTWLSLDAYDKNQLSSSGVTRKNVKVTADQLSEALNKFKVELLRKKEAGDLFGRERETGALAGIIGNVMQSFGGSFVYPTAEEKAAHLLYFMVKNHPFADGNKRSGAYGFIWFLQRHNLLDRSKMSPVALTVLTLLVAESNPKDKSRMVGLILHMLKKH